MIDYIGIFLLNLGIELIVAMILQFRSKKQLLAVVGVNGITHPILTIVMILLVQWGYYKLGFVLVLELLVVLSEWQLFEFVFREKNKKYLILAGIINVTSYGIGLLLFNK